MTLEDLASSKNLQHCLLALKVELSNQGIFPPEESFDSSVPAAVVSKDEFLEYQNDPEFIRTKEEINKERIYWFLEINLLESLQSLKAQFYGREQVPVEEFLRYLELTLETLTE